MILIQYGSKILINTGKNTPIIDSNDEKRITSQTKNDEIVLHPMHCEPEAQTVSSKGVNFLDISMSLPGAQVVVTVTVYGV